MSNDQEENIIKKYKGYLIDLDGTVYKGAERIPTAEIFVKELQDKNIPFLFVTNNATKTAAEVKENLLKNFQIDVTEDHIYTSAMAALDHLSEWNIGKKVLVIGEASLKQEVQSAGFEMVDEHPDFVLQALDRGVTYQQLEAACLAIQQGAKFVATNPDTNLPTERGFIPGAGALTAFLQACTQKEPLIIGKPYPTIMAGAIKRMKLEKDEVIMVGDNYNTDILAGVHYGVDTLMVLTGFSQRVDIEGKDEQPTYIVNDLSEWEV